MYYYQIMGLTIESELQIYSGEEIAETGEVDVRIVKNMMDEIYADIVTFLDTSSLQPEEDMEDPVCMVRRFSKDECIFYVDQSCLLRMTEGKLLEYRTWLEPSNPLFLQWLLNVGISLLKVQRNDLLLHGSLLGIANQEAFIICGDSGSGKSTTTETLLDLGYRFKADDTVPLMFVDGKALAQGCYPTRRLCKNVVEEKKLDTTNMILVPLKTRPKYILSMHEAYDSSPEEVKALFYLKVGSKDSSLQIREVEGFEKTDVIRNNLYQKHAYEALGIDPSLFKNMLILAKQIPFYEITRPEGKDTLADIIDFIQNKLKQ